MADNVFLKPMTHCKVNMTLMAMVLLDNLTWEDFSTVLCEDLILPFIVFELLRNLGV